MALSNRQVSLYTHSVIVWRQTETFAADGKPTAPTWLPSGGAAVYSTVTTGASSATQTVGSTTGMAAGDTLHFATSNANRVISSITSATVVVLTATISTTTGEAVSKVIPCYADLGKSQQELQGQVFLVESDNQFTFDVFSFEDIANLEVGDILKMTEGPVVGKFWTVRGDTMIKNRRANKLSILASRTPTAPNGVK